MRHCYYIDSCLPNIVLESIGKQNSALLEPRALNQLLHYLQEDEKQSAEFSKKKYISEKKTCMAIISWLCPLQVIWKIQNGRIEVWINAVLQYFIRCKNEELILVNAKDRGRLWTINNDAQNTLSITEKTFTHETKNFVFKLNEIMIICVRMQKVWWIRNQRKLVRTNCWPFYQGKITFICSWCKRKT